ncbi:hypothetical protein MMC13_000044 [Lambiella insularis]|nr:hypothetical protein [Lambiella insularis]
MAQFTDNGWNTGDKSGLVSIGTHKLYVSIAGPPRKPGEPLVVIFSGLGGSSKGWPSVMRGVSSFGRIMVYDRTGLGLSEKAPSPSPRTATAIAEEASAVLDAIHQPPHYVLLSQSYGGVLAREFMAQRPKDVVGLCLLDTNQEKTYVGRPEVLESLEVLMQGIDYFAVIGGHEKHKLTDEDWQALLQDDGFGQEYAGLEGKEYVNSMNTLAAHKQFDHHILGSHPVSVVKGNTIRELRLVYAAAVKRGNGTEKQRAALAKMLETFDDDENRLQREQLKLSSRGRFTYAEHSGHNVQVYDPELVVKEVKWILESQAKVL